MIPKSPKTRKTHTTSALPTLWLPCKFPLLEPHLYGTEVLHRTGINLYGSGRQLYDAEVLRTLEVTLYGCQTQLYDPQLLRKQETRNKITKTTSSVITTAEYSSHYCSIHKKGTTYTIYTHIYMQEVLQNTKTDFLSPQHNPVSPGNAPRITINPEKHKLGLPNTT